MDPKSSDIVLSIMEVWVGSEQTLKHLEWVGTGKIIYRRFQINLVLILLIEM